MNNIVIKCYQGIGDSAYTLPFAKELAKSYQVYIKSPLPKIYKDVPNVKFLRFDEDTYRTQEKSLSDDDTIYSPRPLKIEKTFTPEYAGNELLTGSIVSTFSEQLNIPSDAKLEWKLPSFKKELGNFLDTIPKNKKIALIRPATIRSEWRVSTRNPNPNYIAWCCKILNEAGYYTISIADLDYEQEWLADNIDVPAKLKLYSGELGIYGTLELFKHADIVIAGSGFALPAAVSSDTNLFLILGGRLAYDGISKTLHPSMNLNKIGYAQPINPCICTLNEHNCNKNIPDLDIKFFDFLRRINDNSK